MEIDWISRSRNLKPQIRNFVDGRWHEIGGADYLEKHSPRDGSLLCRFRAGEAQDVDRAVANARAAFADGRWSKLPAHQRRDILIRLSALVETHSAELALLESLDVGKPIHDALHFDIPSGAAAIRHSAAAVEHLYGRVYSSDHTGVSYELRRPVGVVAGITGWNFPFLLAAGKIGPALATGNCLVLKPSELTSLSTARVAELAVEAGVPPGVLNVVHGGGLIGDLLARHREVDLITFTGSTRTGKRLLIASGETNMKRLILECGGKAPNVVFDDAPDLEWVADAIVARAFWNQGQVCTASSRLLVQESIKDELLRILTRKVAALTPADPLKSDTRFGAVVSRQHMERVRQYVGSGKDEGARVAYEGTSPSPFESGFYVNPVVFDQVSSGSKLSQEEIFGPVLSTMTFRDEAQAVRLANDTIYGLSAILWTKDMGRAQRVTHAINAGWIVVNATSRPTGGPDPGILSIGGHKQSGLGVEGGISGLEQYTSQTAVQFFV